ncbi:MULTISPECIES: alpha/beta fold hydrolase [unclassified Streptomyces]|uniref:alpha/beta fold hydrolase n=1 Tax=unclassified Streptomyces TaxID=2593676 RepID=UPI0006AF7BAD|nr:MULTISPECIES: alpha/beta hydrolase [unclassified Streptomyces]
MAGERRRPQDVPETAARETGGHRVGVRVLADGSGPLVVAVHGAEGGWREWQPLARELAGDYRLVALDLPWRAGNDYGWGDAGTPGTWLRGALELLDGPVHSLLGHSLGGNAVLELLCAPDAPDLAAAMLFAPFYRPVEDTVDDALEREFRAAFRFAVADGIRISLGTRYDGMDEALFEMIVDTTLDRIGPAGIHSLYLRFAATGTFPVAAIRTPTRVLVGESDPALVERRATALSGAARAVTVSHRPGYGHCFHVSHAAEIAAEFTGFLAGAAGAGVLTGARGGA